MWNAYVHEHAAALTAGDALPRRRPRRQLAGGAQRGTATARLTSVNDLSDYQDLEHHQMAPVVRNVTACTLELVMADGTVVDADDHAEPHLALRWQLRRRACRRRQRHGQRYPFKKRPRLIRLLVDMTDPVTGVSQSFSFSFQPPGMLPTSPILAGTRHPMSTRRSSFLIICLTLMSLMVILTFAALHDMRQQIDTSTGNQRYLLAQAAARTGLDHAVEQILTDYSQTTSPWFATYSGATPSPPTVRLSCRPSPSSDGRYRAPFTAINYRRTATSTVAGHQYQPLYDNDVARRGLHLAADGLVVVLGRSSADWWNWSGYLMRTTARSRYYEPGYYNTSTPLSAGSTTGILGRRRRLFRDLADPSAAVPAAGPDGMFYDDQYRRIPPSGNPQQDRAVARYRLRYTVGVEDLSGHLLLNPIPDMQMLAQCGPVQRARRRRSPTTALRRRTIPG